MSSQQLSFFQLLSEQLSTRAFEMRSFTRHWGTVGANSEEALRHLLRRFLPDRYIVSSGIIVDPKRIATFNPESDPGSRQVDVLVYDGMLNVPLMEYGGLTVLVPEAVALAVECKDSRSYNDVWIALRNIQSVRKLNSKIIGIVFGYQWNTPASMRRQIEKHQSELEPNTIADYIFSLAGNFCALWNPAQAQIEFYSLGESSLAHFWARLLALLEARQGIGSPGLARMRDALDLSTMTQILTPVAINSP
jgi:hypothetical protein